MPVANGTPLLSLTPQLPGDTATLQLVGADPAKGAGQQDRLIPATAFLGSASPIQQPVTGGFGPSTLDGLTNAATESLVGMAIREGAFRTLESFANDQVSTYPPPPGSAVPTISTAGRWLAMEHYLADRDAGYPGTQNITPTIDPTSVIQAAINWCASQNAAPNVRLLPVKTFVLAKQHGTYQGVGSLLIPDAGEVFLDCISPNRTMVHCIVSADLKGTGSNGVFSNETQQTNAVRMKRFHLGGWAFHRPYTDAVDWWSGRFSTDYLGRWTSCAGDWTGITPLFSVSLSSNPAACTAMSKASGANTIYFDQTGVDGSGNPTVSAYMISGASKQRVYAAATPMNIAQMQAYIASAGASGLGLFQLNYLWLGLTAATVAYVSGNSSLPGFSGFAVTVNAPVNPDNNYTQQSQSLVFQNYVYPDKPAQQATPATPYQPELLPMPEIPAGEVIFTTGFYGGGAGTPIWNNAPINYPWFPRGDCINLVGDHITLRGVESSGWSQGQALFNGGGNLYHDRDCKTYCNDMRQNTGAVRLHFSASLGEVGWSISENLIARTGDQCIQPQAASQVGSNGVFKPWSNHSVYMVVQNADAACPNAAPFAIAAPISNALQGIFVVADAVTNNTSTVSFSQSASVTSFVTLGTIYNGASGTTGALTLPAAAYAAIVGNVFVNGGYVGTVNTNSANNTNNNNLQYAGCANAQVPPGSFIIGYSDAGGSTGSLDTTGTGVTGTPNGAGPIVLVLAPPASNAGSPVINRSLPAPKFSFNTGVAVGALTCAIRVNVINCEFFSGSSTQAVNITNQDDSMNVEAKFLFTKLHCWCQRRQGAAGLGVFGSGFGGSSAALYGVEIYDAFSQAVQTTGESQWFSDEACKFKRAQAGRVANFAYSALPNVALTGCTGAQISGEIEGNIGAPPLQLGDTDGVVALGINQPNNCDDSLIGNLLLSYIENGQDAIWTTNSQRVHVNGLRLKQSAPPGSGFTGGGVHLLDTVTKYPVPSGAWHFSAVNFFGYDGTPITLGSGTSAYMSSGAIIAGAAGLPSLPLSPSLAATISVTSVVTGYLAGNWYPCEPFASGAATVGNTALVTQGAIMGLPFKIRQRAQVQAMAFRAPNASDSAGLARLSIYSTTPNAYPSPKSLLLDAGTVSTAASGGIIITVSNGPTLTPGDYVVAYQCSAAGTSTAATLTCAPPGGKLSDIIGNATAGAVLGSSPVAGWTTATSNTGTMPATFPTPVPLLSTGAPFIALKLAPV